MNKAPTFHNQIIDPFFQALDLYSTKNAFCINEVFYTYKQFGQLVADIRIALTELPAENIYLGLIANDDIETYASVFAAWLEGKAYVPLHPNQPVNRCEDIISQMNIVTILDSSEVSRHENHHVIDTKNLSHAGDIAAAKNPVDENRIAYILFTSGSTGIPKGVMISRKNVAAFIDSFLASGITIGENDKCLQCFDLTFDVSVQSFLVPLIKGACVYTVPHDQIKYSYVYGLLTDHKLTFGAMAPSMLRYLKPYFEEIDAPDMRCCILTAEASPVDLVAEWSGCIPNAEIFDFYGPTEATIYCTFIKFNRNGIYKHLNGMSSIGKPMKGITAIILDEEGKVLGLNQKGELCISGDQLTPGYWNNAEKNAGSFIEKEVNGVVQRFYKTGDSCFFDDEGDILYAGRLDYQVKIQGYRIELGEIEFHAREFLAGQNAIAIAFENKTGNTEIALFIEGDNSDKDALTGFLQSRMPRYMVPAKVIFESKFPLNSNGKIDRNLLKKVLKPD